jgi:hypothetical protein
MVFLAPQRLYFLLEKGVGAVITFLVVDLTFLLARVVRRNLEQTLDVPEKGLGG